MTSVVMTAFIMQMSPSVKYYMAEASSNSPLPFTLCALPTYFKLHVRISENCEISENYEIFSKASAEESGTNE